MLFDPININGLVLKNRVVMAAMNLGWARDGAVNERIIDFFAERARGGAGLIVAGGAAVDAAGCYGGFLSIHNDSLLPGHERLTRAIKESGARIGLQLFHAGRYSFGFKEGLEVVAPSALASNFNGFTPRALTKSEIDLIVESFADAAGRARIAGYDLIEVIMSAGYLMSQFLSPLTNLRQDEYGGSAENRMRFPLQVITAIRNRVGPDFPIGVRLGGNDFMSGGNGWQEMADFARHLEKVSVDVINVTGGWHEAPVPQIQSDVPAGTYAYLAARIKEQVNIPVAASNRINNPATAEQILQNKQADLITVARGFLADPEWEIKARTNPARIRRCIACMNCLDELFSGRNGLSCAVNPRCGREELQIEKASLIKKILVVGSGPAGLEAARVASLRGHNVVIWEGSGHIGGQWHLAAVPPGKEEFRSLLDFYQYELAVQGVKIVLNQTANLESIKSAGFDAVILATGASPRSLPFLPDEGANVVNAWDVLAGSPVKGPDIIVVGGGAAGCESALFLAEKGTLNAESLKFMILNSVETTETIFNLLTHGSYRIKLIEMSTTLAADMGRSPRWTLLRHMRRLGVETFTNTRVSAAAPGHVKIVTGDNEEQQLKADTIVLAVGSKPNDRLYYELKDQLPEVYLIGDATGPGRLINATRQGFDLAVQI